MSTETNSSVKLQKFAGWSMVAIAATHAVFFCVVTMRNWSGWASGDLRATEPSEMDVDHALTVSAMDFWALPGGFAATLAIAGLLVVELAKRRITTPSYVAWGLGLWAGLALAILFPSGFALAIIPVGLFAAAAVSRRRASALGG